jgi:NAD(P)H-nitrite reductase large subunit
MNRRYLIIGNGIAGFSAAETIRRQDEVAEITLITDESHGFYSRPGLAYLLSGELPEDMLFSRGKDEYQRLNLNLVHARVQRLVLEDGQAILHDNRVLPYDALLLATGARAVRLKVPGIELGGVFTLDTLEDTRKILRQTKKSRRAVVVGGGITALELVEGLRSHGMETHYLLRKDRYWSGVLDPEESAIIESKLVDQGIRLHKNSQLKQIIGKKGQVEGIEIEGGERIQCAVVGIAVGIRPRMTLAVNAGLDVDRGIMVDGKMRTSDPRIFAAGDVAQVYDPASGRYVLDSLWNTAIEQGRIAGMNMAKEDRMLERGVPFNVTRLAGIVTTIIGTVGRGEVDHDLVAIARGDSEIWRGRPDAFVAESKDSVDRIRVLGVQNKLVGAVVMGEQTLSRPLQHLIAEEVDIHTIRDQLLNAPEEMCPTLLEFWKKRSSKHAE